MMKHKNNRIKNLKNGGHHHGTYGSTPTPLSTSLPLGELYIIEERQAPLWHHMFHCFILLVDIVLKRETEERDALQFNNFRIICHILPDFDNQTIRNVRNWKYIILQYVK